MKHRNRPAKYDKIEDIHVGLVRMYVMLCIRFINIMLLIKLVCIGPVTGPRFAVLARGENL